MAALQTVIAQQQKFRVTPHDLQVLEGSEALLSCEVTNLAGQVQWTKDGFALGKWFISDFDSIENDALTFSEFSRVFRFFGGHSGFSALLGARRSTAWRLQFESVERFARRRCRISMPSWTGQIQFGDSSQCEINCDMWVHEIIIIRTRNHIGAEDDGMECSTIESLRRSFWIASDTFFSLHEHEKQDAMCKLISRIKHGH